MIRRVGRTVSRSALIVVLAATATCGGATEPEVLAISLTPEVGLAVGIGGSVLFYATALDRNGDPTFSGTAEWSTADPSIATIAQDGRATGVSAGSTQVRASMDGVTATASIEVYVPPTVTSYDVGVSYLGRNDYVEYIPGELPVVLSAGHGGDLVPSEIPDRTFGVTARDRNTKELTLQLRDAMIAATGYAPHVVISHLHRVKLDPNREIIEAAQENGFAEQAWREFQDYISLARTTVEQQYGGGMYFDIHGHAHPKARVELGYLLSSDVLNRTDQSLNNIPTVQMSSIREIGRTRPTEFAEIVRGQTSFGGYLEAQGVPVIPSPSDPTPGTDPYFTGGYNTREWGSQQDTELVSGIQLEHHFPGLRDNSANREAYVTKLATVIEQYMLEHFGFYLPTP